jgi:phage terminase large subunit
MSTKTIPINDVYIPFLDNETRIEDIYGGRGSGKSVFVSQKKVLQAAQEPHHKILVVRKVAKTIRLSVWPRLKAVIHELGVPFKENKSEYTLTFPTGSQILCVGADDPEKLKSLEGITSAWVEEATELTEDDFDNIDIALRNEKHHKNQITLTHNPVPVVPGETHWIQDRCINISDDDVVVLKTTHWDNAFLPETNRQRIEALRETNYSLYQMWGLGEFTTLEGVIFDNWDSVDEIPDNARFLGYGLDFGFTLDPTALVGVYQHDVDIYLKELIYQSGLTNQDIAQQLSQLGVDRSDEIIADSAEPKSIEEIHRLGWNIKPAVKGPDSVNHGIDYMKQFRIHLLRGDVNLKREFSTYCWGRDKNNKLLPKPVDDNNHGIDAARYRLTRRLGVVKVTSIAEQLGL